MRKQRIRTPLEVRFWAKVNKDGPVPDYAPHLGPCWIWTGSTGGEGSHGYGEIGSGGKHGRTLWAHRVSYEIANGPLPENDRKHHIDHLCRVPACVNPAHLEYVPAAINSQRGRTPEVQRARAATQTHCIRNHEFTPENTRVVLRPGRPPSRECKACCSIRTAEYEARKKAKAEGSQAA